MNTAIYTHVLTCLLLWLHPSPRDVRRLTELTTIASYVARTDATDEEAEVMVAACKHESGCVLRAVGDGGAARGPWQVHGHDASASAALRLVRWSTRACGDLSLFAGCGRCGACPEIVASLVDPTLPRR